MVGSYGGNVSGGSGGGDGTGWSNDLSWLGDTLDEWAMALGDALGTDPTVCGRRLRRGLLAD